MFDNLKGFWSKLVASKSGEEAEARRQAALFRLSAELAAAHDETEVCERVVAGLHDTLGYDFVAFFLVEKSTGDRVMSASVGFVDPPTRLKPGEGLSELAQLEEKLRYTLDVRLEPRYFYGMGGSEVDVPVRIGGEVDGVLVAESKKRDDFGPQDFEVLTAASQQAGIAIEKARLLADERRRGDELDALRATLTELTAELELPVLLQAIVVRAAGLLNAAGGELGLYDESKQGVKIVVSSGLGRDYVGEFHKLGTGAMGLVAQTGKPLILDDYYTWEGRAEAYIGDEIHAIMAIPLQLGKRLIGVITVVAAEVTRKFAPADVHLLNLFGQQAAIAIENAHLFDEAQREINERTRAETELRKYQEQLEELVEERTFELRQSEERYRTLFDGVPVGLYRSTPAGKIVDANLGMVQMLGYPNRKALLAESAGSVYVDEEERNMWQALMEREGVVRDFDVQLLRYDGNEIWVKDSSRAFKDKSGRVQYYEGSMEDITDRKQAELELRKYQEHLEELVEERTSELRASEERYRSLFDGVPVGLYRSTPDGRILDVNSAMIQMLGYPDREAIMSVEHTSEYYVDPQDQSRWRSLMEKEGIVKDFTIQVRRYDSSVIWANDSARVVRDESGQVQYYEGSFEDITERVRYEDEIQRQKEYFEALFVNNPVAVVTADLNGIVVSWNPMAENLFGYSREDAEGTPLDDLVAKDESIRAEAMGFTNQVLGLDRVQVTTKRTRKDGTFVDVELLALPIIASGEILGFIVIYHDITERIKFEEEILRQKEYFEALFVNNPVAVLTADLDARIVSWNPMAEKLFGYTQEEAIGQLVDDLISKHPEIRQESLNYTKRMMREDRVQSTSKRTRKDGSLVDVETLALPLILAGEKVGYIGIYVDISELQEAQREAEAANQTKSTFLANMSHELRTPLNAILGFTQLMNRDPSLTGEQAENLRVISHSGEHLLGMINEVLEMSKIEAGQVELHQKVFDLYDLFYGLEEMFNLRAADRGLVLNFQWTEDIPRHVFMDEGKLRQVLSNLLGNAIKFTSQGEVTLRVKCSIHSNELARLLFEVEDTGPGISPEELDAIFDPFVQASIGQRFQEGTGLGLSISSQYVRLMGGELSVESELGQGSLFRFELLVDFTSKDELEREELHLQVIGLEPGQPDSRLLIAEDDEVNRRLLVKLLQPLGFVVKEAANGQEAIQIWESWEPDLIYMDMRMPVMDGHEATLHIRASSEGQSTVIIALTATAFEEEREKVLFEGCDDFVRKPFHEYEIYDMLTKHLGVKFIYEEQELQIHSRQSRDSLVDALSPADLAGIPSSVLSALYEAALEADLPQMLDIIDDISEPEPAVAEQLSFLAQDFKYKRIITLLEKIRGEG